MSIEPLKKHSMKTKPLKIFFAVTRTSVYRAVIDGEENVPYLEKIAKRIGDASKVPVGNKIDNGTMLSVGKQLWLFVPEGSGFISPTSTIQREIASVNTNYWGGHTSSVVALCLKEKDARICLEKEYFGRQSQRFAKHTITVLRAIGENHPFCSITDDSEMRLMPKRQWFE